ncbi:MAG: hypothetical protein OXF75_12120 [Acidimicrobiaceae bacterium]|nr:hypothetical protein [Acidimicrobiaceae bacterium]
MQHRFERSPRAGGAPGEVKEAELLGDDVFDLAFGDRQGQAAETAPALVPRGDVGENLRTVPTIPAAGGWMGTQRSSTAAKHHRISGMAEGVDERIEAVRALRPRSATGVAPRTDGSAGHKDSNQEVEDDNDEPLRYGTPTNG